MISIMVVSHHGGLYHGGFSSLSHYGVLIALSHRSLSLRGSHRSLFRWMHGVCWAARMATQFLTGTHSMLNTRFR